MSLDEDPAWYTTTTMPYGDNASEGDWERAKSLIPKHHPYLSKTSMASDLLPGDVLYHITDDMTMVDSWNEYLESGGRGRGYLYLTDLEGIRFWNSQSGYTKGRPWVVEFEVIDPSSVSVTRSDAHEWVAKMEAIRPLRIFPVEAKSSKTFIASDLIQKMIQIIGSPYLYHGYDKISMASIPLYHCAPTAQRESILGYGLDPQHAPYERSTGGGNLYGFSSLEEAQWYADYMSNMEPQSSFDIWMIAPDENEMWEKDYTLYHNEDDESSSSLFTEETPIPPDRLTLVETVNERYGKTSI